jgi:putative ABC transport system substrate-binding protein
MQPAMAQTPTQQLFALKELYPSLKAVGVLTNQTPSEELTRALNKASAATGVKVIVTVVNSIADLAPKFRELVSSYQVQGIWLLDNTGALSSSAARDFLYKNTVTRNLALLVPDKAMVSEGGLLHVTSEGGQLRLYVNQRVAQALNVKVPEQYQAQATFVSN